MDQRADKNKYHQQRLAAIRAAATVFASKGYHGASTKDIAEQLGIKQGSLYYYFKSKQEALGEVCLFGIEDYVHHMEEIAANQQPFEAKLLAVITSHLTAYRERNEALIVHNHERLYLPVEKRTRLKELGSHYRELLEGVFRGAIDDGVLRPTLDPHFAAQSIIGICNAWGELIVRDPDLDLFQLVQKSTNLLLDGMLDKK